MSDDADRAAEASRRDLHESNAHQRRAAAKEEAREQLRALFSELSFHLPTTIPPMFTEANADRLLESLIAAAGGD